MLGGRDGKYHAVVPIKAPLQAISLAKGGCSGEWAKALLGRRTTHGDLVGRAGCSVIQFYRWCLGVQKAISQHRRFQLPHAELQWLCARSNAQGMDDGPEALRLGWHLQNIPAIDGIG